MNHELIFLMNNIAYHCDYSFTTGGDVEHTHLVKGLDYALLRKIKQEQLVETKIDASKVDKPLNTDIIDLNHIITASTLGNNIKSYLISFRDNRQSDVQTDENKTNSKESTLKSSSIAIKLFKQLAYEFDLDPILNIELPTLISNSRYYLSSSYDEKKVFVPSNQIMEKLISAFKKISSISKTKRKKNEDDLMYKANYLSNVAEVTEFYQKKTKDIEKKTDDSTVKSNIAVIDDIYGGIVEVGGKYVPVGAIDDSNADSIRADTSAGPNSETNNFDMSSLFQKSSNEQGGTC